MIWSYEGITEREWLAGLAMQAAIAGAPGDAGWPDPEAVAEYAFKCADAMLNASAGPA